MINISLTDLLNAPETAPVAPPRPGDAAAFTGLLDQFDRREADATAKPARPRAERTAATNRDDEPAKTARSKAPTAAKAKPTAAPEQNAAPTREDASAPQEKAGETGAAPRDAVASDETADDADGQSADTLPLQTTAPAAAVVEKQPMSQISMNMTTDGADDDAVAGVAAMPTQLASEADAATDAMAPLAGATANKADPKSKAPAPQMLAAETANAATDDVAAQPAQTPSPAANAQAADLTKRLDNQPLQVAVQVATNEPPKPLKTPVALANGMSHPAQTDATTTTQTASATPATDGAAAPTVANIDMPDVQPAMQTPMQSATPAFAGLVEAATDKTAPVAGKPVGGESAAVGSIGAAGPTTTANAAQSAAQTAKSAPLPHPVTEQVAVHIAKASADGVDKINVKLKPASLGHVEVQLDLAADGRVQVVVSADRADTLDLLQRDARGLERALNDAGLQMNQQSLSFNLRDQGMPQGNAGNDTTGRAGWHGGAEGADEPLPAVGGYLNARAAVGGVDIRV